MYVLVLNIADAVCQLFLRSICHKLSQHKEHFITVSSTICYHV